MGKRPSQNDAWTELAVQLRQVLQEERLSLRAAQRLFDEAPDGCLTETELAALVADVLWRKVARDQGVSGFAPRDLHFTAHTWLRHPDDLVGMQVICPGSDLVTDVNSSCVDVRRLKFPRWSGDLGTRHALTDPIVFDVVPDFDELDRSQARRVRQGTLRWTSYSVDASGLETIRDEMIYDAWCHWTSVHDDTLERLWEN